MEVVPFLNRESGYYSQYFIVPKKDGGLRKILDLRLFNRSVMRLKFKMLTVKQVVSQIRSDGGSTSRCRSRSYERIVVKTKREEKCTFSITEDHLSGRFNRNAGMYVPYSDRVDSHVSQEIREGQSLTVKQFKK